MPLEIQRLTGGPASRWTLSYGRLTICSNAANNWLGPFVVCLKTTTTEPVAADADTVTHEVAAPIPAHAPVTRIVEYSMRTAFLSDEADSDEGRQTGR